MVDGVTKQDTYIFIHLLMYRCGGVPMGVMCLMVAAFLSLTGLRNASRPPVAEAAACVWECVKSSFCNYLSQVRA